LPSPAGKSVGKDRCPATEVLEKDLIESYVTGSRAFSLVVDEDILHGRSHFSPFLKDMSDRDRYSVALTHKLIQEIADVAMEKKAAFRIFHPYRSDLDASFREIKCVKTIAGEYFEFDGSDWLRFLKQSPLKEQLITLEINDEKPMNVSKGDWHLSEAGNARVMRELAAKLVATGLVHAPLNKSIDQAVK
jgi:hypothetical protein